MLQDSMQASALHLAAREGQLLALHRLITMHSVDVNIKDAWGWTPLDSAVMAEQWPSAVLLTSWGGMLQMLPTLLLSCTCLALFSNHA
jgi:ankyrin repeat protein